jgi:hypothetical protein
MDFSWLIYLLIFLLVLAGAFAIIKFLIMPALPAPWQPFIWAIIGIALLIALLVFVGSGGSGFLHGNGFNFNHH